MTARIILDTQTSGLRWLVATYAENGVGTVVGVNPGCSHALAEVYRGQVVDISDCHPGLALPLADPYENYELWNSRHIIDRIQLL